MIVHCVVTAPKLRKCSCGEHFRSLDDLYQHIDAMEAEEDRVS